MIGQMSDLKIFSSDISVNNKRVIVRLDLNVPINNSGLWVLGGNKPDSGTK